MKKKLMFNCIKNQYFTMVRKKNYWIAFYLILCYSFCTYILNLYNSMGHDKSSIYSSANYFAGNYNSPILTLFVLSFSIVIVLPFSFSYYDDAALQNLQLLQTRIGKKNYFISSAITSFIGSFQIIFIPFILNIILNFISFPQNDVTIFGVNGSHSFWLNLYGKEGVTNLLFANLFLYNQDLYNIFITLILSSFAGILGVFAYAISLHIPKYKLLIFLPTYLLFFVTDHLSWIGFRFDLLDFVLVTNGNRQNFCFLLLLIAIITITVSAIRKKINMESLS